VGVFWPLLSQLHAASADAKIKKTFFFATKISVCVASFLCFGLIAWGKPMIQRWMGLRYMDSYGPLVVLTLAVLLDLLQLPSVSLLFATFKHRVYAFSNLTEGILNLGVSLILVRQYGILGVALGTLVAAIVIRIIVQPWWMCRVSQISYSVYARFLAGNVGRCAGLIGASYLLISWGLRPNYVYLFGSAACASVLYAAGSWLVVFDKNERDLFRAALRKQVNKQDLTRVVAPSVAI
jgi:O-antigen/teichoic acid export membrane protein